MIVSDIIIRLRERLPSYGNRIAGASAFQEVEENSKMTVPALYVMLGDTSAQDRSEWNANYKSQKIREELHIVAVISNKMKDAKGAVPQDHIHAIRATLWNVLYYYNQEITGEETLGYTGTELAYVGDSILGQDKERYFHLFKFKHEFEIDNEQNGIGASNPEPPLADFVKLVANIEPTLIDPDEQPSLVATLDNLDA